MLNRVFKAIRDYNDSSPENRVLATNGILRELTGCNGNDITKWMKAHNDELISYFSKFSGMVIEKDNKQDFNVFYNRTNLRGMIDEIVEKIKKEYLLTDI
jgi:hypothetical protein